jgi:hypothetical protein
VWRRTYGTFCLAITYAVYGDIFDFASPLLRLLFSTARGLLLVVAARVLGICGLVACVPRTDRVLGVGLLLACCPVYLIGS